uniref:Uncharacterized protein n=1 Tax=Trichogramma kaykai TaxID=54128 RepID=A0ABD2XEH9_9HYME
MLLAVERKSRKSRPFVKSIKCSFQFSIKIVSPPYSPVQIDFFGQKIIVANIAHFSKNFHRLAAGRRWWGVEAAEEKCRATLVLPAAMASYRSR